MDDDDDDNISIVSSCMGSVESRNSDFGIEEEYAPAEVEVDWSLLDADVRVEKIGDSLKRLGNVAKKKMSPLIEKDMLGFDGELAIKGCKKKPMRSVKKENRKVEDVYNAVKLFEHKMAKRREMLHKSIKQSKEKNSSETNTGGGMSTISIRGINNKVIKWC